ncbi:MAG: helix-turn-helix domain-containing protein [Actinomycetales bacterium]|nr:helix-turn-helix domain-containing protein [Actinomycetales bacterium]
MRMSVTVQLWTHAEVAAWLRVEEEVLMHLVTAGAGPVCYWVGRHRRYDPAEVGQWLATTPEDFYWPTSKARTCGAAGRHAA